MNFEAVAARHPLRMGEQGCWLWQGRKTQDGYGYVMRGPRLIFAHRLIYTLVKGKIPAGAHLDHRCRNRDCVNPDHLEPVTQKVNTERGEGPTALNARKTYCKRGHPFNEENTIYRKDGSRRCRLCWGAKTEQLGQGD